MRKCLRFHATKLQIAHSCAGVCSVFTAENQMAAFVPEGFHNTSVRIQSTQNRLLLIQRHFRLGGQPMSRILRTTQVATATYTTGQAAARIGISRQTLQAWIAAKKLTPPEPIKVGELTVRLWSHSDVEAARECVKENRPGPRRKASAEISEDL